MRNALRSFAIGIIITLLGCALAYAQTTTSGRAQLCWQPAEWPVGWVVEGYNVTVSDPSVEPFVKSTIDAGIPTLNASGLHVVIMAIPENTVEAAKLRFTVEAYGRDDQGSFAKSEPSNALDITCSEIGVVGGVNVCPTNCVPSDADCDGRVTASDALLVLRIALGIQTAPECSMP